MKEKQLLVSLLGAQDERKGSQVSAVIPPAEVHWKPWISAGWLPLTD